jgi:hypothetical protein
LQGKEPDMAGQNGRQIHPSTAIGSSRLNLVERFFRDLTGDVVRKGSFTSVMELVRSMETCLVKRNLSPSATYGKRRAGGFWTKSPGRRPSSPQSAPSLSGTKHIANAI